MNILLVSTTLNMNSGASWSLLYLAIELRTRGYTPLVLLPSSGELEKYLNNEGIQTIIVTQCTTYDWINESDYKFPNTFSCHVERAKHRIVNFIAILKICKVIKQEKIDIVHINTLTGYIAAYSAKICNVKLIWHIREFLEEDLNLSFINPKKSYKLISQSDAIIAVSKSVKDKYQDYLIPKINIVHNGVNIDKYLCEKNIFNNQKINIAITGRVSEKKGQLDLIKSLEILLKRGYENLHVFIVGPYEDKSDYIKVLKKYIVKHNLSDYITFTGFTSNVKEILNICDIICVCSYSEAFGRVTVEGLLSGSLVIGANNAGTLEILTHMETGLLYEVRNIKELANCIQFSIDNPNIARKIALKGQEFAKYNYSDKLNADKISDIYQKII